MFSGRLIDVIGSRKVFTSMLIVLLFDIALTPWSSAATASAALAIAVWGACGWGLLVPQQYRLVTLAPSIAPVVLGLNTSSTYLGVTVAGVIGAAGIRTVGAHSLGLIAAALLVIALLIFTLASRDMGK